MKKLLLITALLLAIGGLNAQTTVGPKTLATITNLDTIQNYDLTIQKASYAWMFQLSWTKNDDSLSVIPMYSLDSTNWVLYPGLDTVITTAATGTMSWDDEMFTGKYIRFRLIPTDTVTGTLKYFLKLK